MSEAHPTAISLPDAAAPYPAYRLQTDEHATRECSRRLPRLSRKIAGAAREESSPGRGTSAASRDLTVLVFGLIPDRTDREQTALKPRIRQLLCLWLVTVIALLPVSGSLLAATLAAGSDNDAQGIHMGHAHHGADAPAADDGTRDIAPLFSLHHDCGTALCAGGCSGCTACHAPPVNHLLSADSADLVHAFLPVTASTPPPGAVFRPPIATTA